MSRRKIAIEFIFEEYEEEFGDESYTNHDLVAIRRLPSTDLTDEEISNITEGLAQSDYWHVEAVNAILPAMETAIEVAIRE